MKYRRYSLRGDDILALKRPAINKFPNMEKWRGPHEGIELELMLINKKPASIISENRVKRFISYIKSGRFIKRIIKGQYGLINDWVIALSDQKYRLKKLVNLCKMVRPHEGKIDRYTIKMGILLGYDKEDILNFIKY